MLGYKAILTRAAAAQSSVLGCLTLPMGSVSRPFVRPFAFFAQCECEPTRLTGLSQRI